MSLLCKHTWEVLDKTILESAYEQMRASNQVLQSCEFDGGRFFVKKLILVCQCNKCGKINKTVESNP